MAPKQPEDNSRMNSSTEEEEEQSGSSGGLEEASESTHDNSKKDYSSSDDEEVDKSTHIPKIEPESDSDSDTKPNLPESSTTGKRSLIQTEEFELKKKMKKPSDGEEKISGDEAKQMFQRLFSETDEIALLQGILDFTSTRGDPMKEMDVFVDYVKKLINFDANRSQLKTKIQRLKKKFANTVENSLKKGKSEDEIVFSRDVDQRVFDLSRKIWGDNGVSVSKSRSKKVEESPKSLRLVPHKKIQETVKPEADVVVDSTSLELSDFFKTENVYAFGLDETALIGIWDMVKDGSKKRAVEEKLRKLRAMQVELCLKRTGLVAESAKLIFNDNASSSSGM